MPPRRRHLLLASLVILAVGSPALAGGRLRVRGGDEFIYPNSVDVEAVVEDGLAATTILLTFRPESKKPLDCIFEYAAPADAHVTGVSVQTGVLRLEGMLIPRREAQRIRDRILEEAGEPPAALDAERDRFRIPVSPVLPGFDTIVTLSYVREEPLEDGYFRYAFPYSSDGMPSYSFRVTVRSLLAFVEVSSSVENATVETPKPTEAVVTAQVAVGEPDDEFVVFAEIQARRPILAVRTFRESTEGGWFTAVLTPSTMATETRVPRDVILVMDTSGSMNGAKIIQAKAAAQYLVNHLSPDDRVNIIRFHALVEAFAKSPVPATPKNLERLRAFVDRMVANGGTALGNALRQAVNLRVARGRVRTVVLLTDGQPTVGVTDRAAIIGYARKGAKSGLRIHTFGITPGVDPYLLEAIAIAGKGTATLLPSNDEIRSRLQEFLDRTSKATLTGLELTAEGVQIRDVVPDSIPDAYPGEQVVLTGRFVGSGEATLTMAGHVGAKVQTAGTTLEFPAEPGGSRLVALRHALASLAGIEAVARLRLGLSHEAFAAVFGDDGPPGGPDPTGELTTLAIRHGILTPRTSFVLVTPDDRKTTYARDLERVEASLERAQRVRVALLPDEKEAAAPGGVIARFGRVDVALGAAPHAAPVVRTAAAPGAPGANPATAAPPPPPPPWPRPFFRGRLSRTDLGANGGSGPTENAVRAGLDWLARHQHGNGRWSAKDFSENCRENPCGGRGRVGNDIGVTGLALLAFLGAGHVPEEGRYGAVVLRGLRWLMTRQDYEGCFGDRAANRYVYGHAIATQAMAEAYGMTGSVFFKESALEGLDFIAKCRNPALAWRYGFRPDDSDTSVSAWMTMALVAGRQAGLVVDPAALEGMRNWLTQVTDAGTGRAGYTSPDNGPVRDRIAWERFPKERSESMTAAGVLCRILLDEVPAGSAPIIRGAVLCANKPPVWVPDAGTIDMYYWHFGSLAIYQVGGALWTIWNQKLRDAAIPSQQTEGDETGSWGPDGPWGHEGGRVYSTALMTLCLETYYRYPRRFDPLPPSLIRKK